MTRWSPLLRGAGDLQTNPGACRVLAQEPLASWSALKGNRSFSARPVLEVEEAAADATAEAKVPEAGTRTRGLDFKASLLACRRLQPRRRPKRRQQRMPRTRRRRRRANCRSRACTPLVILLNAMNRAGSKLRVVFSWRYLTCNSKGCCW